MSANIDKATKVALKFHRAALEVRDEMTFRHMKPEALALIVGSAEAVVDLGKRMLAHRRTAGPGDRGAP